MNEQNIIRLLQQLKLEHSFFSVLYTMTLEEYDARIKVPGKVEESAQMYQYQNLAQYILQYKSDATKEQTIRDFDLIRFRTELLVFTPEEFQKIIKALFIIHYYEIKKNTIDGTESEKSYSELPER
jgi:hypothetical protein